MNTLDETSKDMLAQYDAIFRIETLLTEYGDQKLL
jgi:hypothetical protein